VATGIGLEDFTMTTRKFTKMFWDCQPRQVVSNTPTFQRPAASASPIGNTCIDK
jgi:hypothetical protein